MIERELFAQALELPAGEQRAAFLERACRGDSALRERLERLLAERERLAGYLETAPAGLGSTIEEPSSLPAGTRIGRYRLLEPIGEGGMGAVWAAEQEAPVKRRVALKLIKPGMDSRQVLARFDAERQALALMDHPNIARVYDGGMTDEGRPYFVMEFVQGVPITQYCDAARLPIRERLQLFVSVCQAVQHAHQKGVIHRDLKPSNILVCVYDGAAVAKVIDFGLAKATSSPLTEKTLQTVGLVVGTPLYMSPEQAGFGDLDIDTRSDIYSLGVILYELLAGTTPLEARRLEKAPTHEVLRLLKENEPPTPSARVSSSDQRPSIAAQRGLEGSQLSRTLRGDLDWIVMKSLDKERQRRYESASSLARDIERYLRGEAVEAGPPTVGYRLRKFVRRQRAVLSVAAVIAAVLLAATAISTWQAVGLRYALADKEKARAGEATQRGIADKKRQEAEIEKRRAIEFRDLVLDALRATTDTDVEQLIGEKAELTASERAYVEAIASRWLTFARRGGTDEQSRAMREEGHRRVAYLWHKLGRRDESLQELGQARDLLQQLTREFPGNLQYARSLAATHNNTAVLLKELSKWNEARPEYEEACRVLHELLPQFAQIPEVQDELAGYHCNLAGFLDAIDTEAARGNYEQALEIQEAVVAKRAQDAAFLSELARIRHNYGKLLLDLGQYDGALSRFQAALEIQEPLGSPDAAPPPFAQALAVTYQSLGVVRTKLDRLDDAVTDLKQALAIQSRLSNRFPGLFRYREDESRTHLNLATVYIRQGRREDAYAEGQQGLEMLGKLAAQFGQVRQYQVALASGHEDLAINLIALQKFREARVAYEHARDAFQKLGDLDALEPSNQGGLARCHLNLGKLLHDSRDPLGACREYRAAIAIVKRLTEAYPKVPLYGREWAKVQHNMGAALMDLGQTDDAEASYRKALELLRPLRESDEPEAQVVSYNAHNAFAILLRAKGQVDGAKAEYKQARDILRSLTNSHPEEPQYQLSLAMNHNNMGNLFWRVYDWAAGKSEFEEALELLAGLIGKYGAEPRFLKQQANAQANFGGFLADQCLYAEARAQLEKARDTFAKLARETLGAPEYEDQLARSHFNLGNLYKDLGDLRQARVAYEQAVSGWQQLVNNHQDDLTLKASLGRACCALGEFLLDHATPDGSLDAFANAIDNFTAVRKVNARNADVADRLSRSHAGRARAYHALADYNAAIESWDQALALCPPALHAAVRIDRAHSLAKAGQVAAAVAAIAALAEDQRLSKGLSYNCACIYSLASGQVAEQKQEYANRALKLLKQAVANGWDDAIHMKLDADLDPVRGRPEFQEVLTKIPKPAQPGRN